MSPLRRRRRPVSPGGGGGGSHGSGDGSVRRQASHGSGSRCTTAAAAGQAAAAADQLEVTAPVSAPACGTGQKGGRVGKSLAAAARQRTGLLQRRVPPLRSAGGGRQAGSHGGGQGSRRGQARTHREADADRRANARGPALLVHLHRQAHAGAAAVAALPLLPGLGPLAGCGSGRVVRRRRWSGAAPGQRGGPGTRSPGTTPRPGQGGAAGRACCGRPAPNPGPSARLRPGTCSRRADGASARPGATRAPLQGPLEVGGGAGHAHLRAAEGLRSRSGGWGAWAVGRRCQR